MRALLALLLALASPEVAAQSMRPNNPGTFTGGTLTSTLTTVTGACGGTMSIVGPDADTGIALTSTPGIDACINGVLKLRLLSTDSANASGTLMLVPFATPADSSGTNDHYGLRIQPSIGNATAGTNTVRALSIDGITADPQVNIIGIDIATLNNAGAEAANAINIGNSWDAGLDSGSPVRVSGAGPNFRSATATIDFTTSGNEDLTLDPGEGGGSGSVVLISEDNNTELQDSAGALDAYLQTTTSATGASVYRTGSADGGAYKVSSSLADHGRTDNAAATVAVDCASDGVSPTAATQLDCVYGSGARRSIPATALAIGATDTTTSPFGGGAATQCRMSAANPASTWVPSETSALDGLEFCCTNTGANVITMTDSSGVYEGSGSAVGQWDVVCFSYVTDRWVEQSFKDN